jgi:hypothetical protein
MWGRHERFGIADTRRSQTEKWSQDRDCGAGQQKHLRGSVTDVRALADELGAVLVRAVRLDAADESVSAGTDHGSVSHQLV